MSKTIQTRLPPRAPTNGNALTRWVGRSVLRLGGWTVRGEVPDVDKLLIIAAPHSSAWDGIWGLAAKLALGIDLHIMAKAELFQGPSGVFLGPLLRWFGAVPIDRHSSHGLVEQTVAQFRRNDVFWAVLAPEGTRRQVERWRSGFWHIAHDAGVPVLCAYFHYPDRLIGFGECVQLSGDRDADMARIRDYYRPFMGKNRGAV